MTQLGFDNFRALPPGLVVAFLLLACNGLPGTEDGGQLDAVTGGGGPLAPPICDGVSLVPPNPVCGGLPTDYTPGADDSWPPCISDDGQYHRVLDDISTIGRVQAYTQLADLLFDETRDPSPDDFLAARLIYQQEQGLDSRVVRRYDPHFAVPAGTDCATPDTPALYPDYCVGPARLQLALLDAFAAGIAGGTEAPRVFAAQVHGALLWFLYVSTFKESLTCTRNARDCDSAFAYYTGGEDAGNGLGLAAEVRAIDPRADDRAFTGALAVRCWRDLDPAELAVNLEQRDLAREQYDRAILDGMAALVRRAFTSLCVSRDDELRAHYAFLQTLGPVLDRRLRTDDPTAADALTAELQRSTATDVDVARALDAIDRSFGCP